jgi:hypothetical protein
MIGWGNICGAIVNWYGISVGDNDGGAVVDRWGGRVFIGLFFTALGILDKPAPNIDHHHGSLLPSLSSSSVCWYRPNSYMPPAMQPITPRLTGQLEPRVCSTA